MVENFIQFVQENKNLFVNYRFSGLFGEQKQISRIFDSIDKKTLTNGLTIDGSSIKGWNNIDNSDILLKPDLSQFFIEPYCKDKSITILCDVIDVNNGQLYLKDPRSIARKSEELLKKLNIANKVFCGSELEFFAFNGLSYSLEN